MLESQDVVENGEIKAKWFVFPGWGTGDLSGLRGEGGFEGDFGSNDPLPIQSAGHENMGPGACQFVIGSGNERWI